MPTRRSSAVRFITELACWIGILILLSFALFPLIVMIITSIKTPAEVFSSPMIWWPKRVVWENYVRIFEAAPLAKYLKNSAIIATGTTIVSLLASAPAAYTLSRRRFIGRKAFLLVILASQMFARIVLVIPLFRTLVMLKWLNTYHSLILVNAAYSLGFSIWLLYSYIDSIPIQMEESAMVDGCTPMQALIKIVVPIAAPGLVTTLIYTFIGAWNEFMFALTFMTREDMKPVTLGLFDFVKRDLVDWHYLMAGSVVTIIPVLILFFTIEKHITRGLTSGAVKG